MPQDLFTLQKVVSELNALIIGAKIQKINMPSDYDVVFTIYNGKTNKLAVSCNAKNSRVGLTTVDKPNPLVAKNFCMLLRKHLLGARISGVNLYNNDRIIALTFENQNELFETVSYVLYAEIMNKYSNVFLTANGVILGLMRNAPQNLDSTRITLTGAKYLPPLLQNKFNAYDNDSLIKAFSLYLGGDLSKFILSSFNAFSPVTADELANRILNKGEFTVDNAVKVTNEFLALPISPVVIYNGKSYDYFAVNYPSISGERIYFDALTSAIDYAVCIEEDKSNFNSNKNALISKISAYEKKQIKSLNALEDKLRECNNADTYKLYAELITANIYRLNKGMVSANLVNYYSETGETVLITLDKNLSPNENAQKYYKKYSKLKKSRENVEARKQVILNELDYIESIKFHVNSAKTSADLNEISEELIIQNITHAKQNKQVKKKVVAPIYREYLVENFTVKVGKNNIQNDSLTFSANRTDIWLHAKNYHSAHVIIETNNMVVPDSVIKIASEITAYYSQGGGDKIPVDYTLKKYVKKPPKAKPGSVIYTNYKTAYATPNEHKELLK
ncbi:MAG: NFACT family protein [Clostridia bacterium]|nr:NFACT family protein [Clostridia bacterium]